MKLLLIRHGETVDNIGGRYAGNTDSVLTNHGVEQIEKLGLYFATSNVKFTHIFSSPLLRALKTAEAIRHAQITGQSPTQPPPIVQVPDLIEQDFGFYEGKRFQARLSSNKSGREADAETHKHDAGFVDVESKVSMGNRADNFLDRHLIPLLADTSSEAEHVVAVVSHGMLLSTLWRRVLLRVPPKSLTIDPEVTASRGALILEHLGGWSNTGYLEVSVTTTPEACANKTTDQSCEPARSEIPDISSKSTPELRPNSVPIEQTHKILTDYSFAILAVDSKRHLFGLKRQRGGIGRLAHDGTQRRLDTFFKKPRLESPDRDGKQV